MDPRLKFQLGWFLTEALIQRDQSQMIFLPPGQLSTKLFFFICFQKLLATFFLCHQRLMASLAVDPESPSGFRRASHPIQNDYTF